MKKVILFLFAVALTQGLFAQDYSATAPFVSPSRTTCGASNDCFLGSSEDHVYAVTIPSSGSWTFSLCSAASYDTYLYIGTTMCGTDLGINDDFCTANRSEITITVNAGTYYVTVAGFSSNCGDYVLNVAFDCSLTANLTSSDPTSCAIDNGSITANASGGTMPYAYVWNTGAITATVTGLGPGSYSVTVTDVSGCIGTSTATLFSTGTPTLSMSSNPAMCADNDGSATATVFGGTFPYIYQWDANASSQNTSTAMSLTTGNYYVTVTDAAGCSVTDYVYVYDAGSGPFLSLITTDVTCFDGNDGTAAASATGTTAPYSYIWSNGAKTSVATGLTAGTYQLQVTDANGCISNSSTTVYGPSMISASFSTFPSTCGGFNGGSATLFASGGTGSYSYAWSFAAGNQTSQTATGLSAGSYNVTITDASSCSEEYSVNVSDAGAGFLDTYSSGVDCFGQSNGSAYATIFAGSPPYNYAWSNGSTADSIWSVAAGTYTVTVTDASGCVVVEDVEVSTPSPLIASPTYINTSSTSACDGQASCNVTGGTFPFMYAWNDPLSQTGSTAFGLCVQSYSVIITDANGCTTSSSIFVDFIPMGINGNQEVQEAYMSVYPNPNIGEFTLDIELGHRQLTHIKILSLDGRIIYSEELGEITIYKANINLEMDAKGIYFVVLSTENTIVTRKVVIH